MHKVVEPIPATFDQIVAKMAGRPVPKEFSVVSLFSGCGGLDLGFMGGFKFLGKTYDRLPFEVEWANDLNPDACETYRMNLREDIHCGDVWAMMDTLPKRADVVVGGFPCQDLSINGNRKGIAGEKSGLYTALVEAVKRCKPKVFVAENVRGLLMDYSRADLEKILSDFEALGYTMSKPQLYLAANYGVPQMRERVFIVGTAPGVKPFVPPKPTHDKDHWITCKEAVGDLEELGEVPLVNHIWSKAKKTADQGGRKLKADKPSDTIRAECHGNIQFHYKLPRRMSMREAARMQSFPDNFLFSSGIRAIERQVGNAVPPVLGWHIAKAVRDCLT